MAKVNLSLSESKSKVTLSLESKGASHTWNTIKGIWNDQINSTWNVQKEGATLETKTKTDLTLENK
ncbi:MAG TPA: hypothetical protein ENI23_10690 [bacterium]|nr:hypothetical protein [bacterium]